MLESHAGGNILEKAVQPKPSTLPPTQVSQPDPVDKKKIQEQKGKEVTKERRSLPPKEAEVQRGGKQARVMQTRSSSEGAIIGKSGD